MVVLILFVDDSWNSNQRAVQCFYLKVLTGDEIVRQLITTRSTDLDISSDQIACSYA